MLDSGDHGVWFAVSVADTRQELLQRKSRFARLACVQRIDEITSLLPPVDSEKMAAIRRIQRDLHDLPDQLPLLPVVPKSVLLEQLLKTHAIVQSASGSWGPLPSLVQQVGGHLQQDNWSVCSQAISRFQQRLAGEVLDQLRQLSAMASPDGPTASDLPAALLDRFVGRGGRHLLRIYARGSIWDMAALERFVQEVESVDPQVTGHPIQTYYSSRQMQQSYAHAAVYSLLAVAIVLMLDLRSVRLVLLAIMPMACGMLQLFGLLGWLGLPLNPANLIVLPLILGIGIDDGVHIVHDFLRRDTRYAVSRSTASAVVLTSATTMVGFGSMMIAHHQGLRSLGQVLTLGVLCCLLTSLIMLPAALALIARHRQRATASADVAISSASGLRRPHRRESRSTARTELR